MSILNQSKFVSRHIGPRSKDIQYMLSQLGCSSLDELCRRTVPASIYSDQPIDLPEALSEQEALTALKEHASDNQVWRSYIGMGFSNCYVPSVIQRNVLENPGWYTQYTPYQAEISQGRLEALLNFQTMVCDLTGLQVANASLLDESTASAEAMNLSFGAVAKSNESNKYFVSKDCHPHTIAVLETRAAPLGIELVIENPETFDFNTPIFGALLPYPTTTGEIKDYRAFIKKCHESEALVTITADLLSLCVLKSPGELGADICVGSTQRFGVPLGFGGPHAAFFATKDELKRKIPGRIVGVSIDRFGNQGLRLALQTREQHIRRDKATSNICTSQVLLAIMASMYAVYHGPNGLRAIAQGVHQKTCLLADLLRKNKFNLASETYFDTITVNVSSEEKKQIIEAAKLLQINFRADLDNQIGISLDETTSLQDVADVLSCFTGKQTTISELPSATSIPDQLQRSSSYLDHPVFNEHHSETRMQRYIKLLESRDLSLTRAMIPLGSCTMKLNSASSLYPISWREFSGIHPYAPPEQTTGYIRMITELEAMLARATGFSAVSLQPNSGAQGEYAGLLTIRAYHHQRGEAHRNVCLIPVSAHGTNPASAVMAGMRVVPVKCDESGNIDFEDLKKRAEENAANLAATMITYPSTHGVFEEGIREICQVVHKHGGQVYLDGANLNAQLGLCYPGEYGPDVCHLNLHKTFSIPHGGGGPGVGPIAVRSHLAPFLPGHPLRKTGGDQAIGPVSQAPWGSAGILQIPWMYIKMLGHEGLKLSSQVAILNANYIAKRLSTHYDVLYKGREGFVAHECIIDLRPMKAKAGIEVEDVAKRLIDYGFHAPTMSWPVAGTLMIEPTESEDLEELDRFCDAMLSIHREMTDIEEGKRDRQDNVLKNAPHTAKSLLSDEWPHSYSREEAAYPLAWIAANKFWPPVARVDNVYGDRNLVCSCLPMEAYSE